MKKTILVTLTIALALTLTACPPEPVDRTLSGTVAITPPGTVNAGTVLTATYSGTETVAYQWYKDNVAIDGATSPNYTPTDAGRYTVTVSASGYTSKTSAAVTVIAHTHTYSAEWTYDAAGHWRECTANDGAKTDEAAHDGDPCTVCGYTTHVHEYAAAWSNDAAQHWHECTANDGAKSGAANHDYNSNFVCTVCGYAHIHSYGATWLFDATEHWKECTADGAKGEVAAHDGDPCTVCGYDSSITYVTFSDVTANGSATATTTTLTLTFSEAITGLSANDITLSGVTGVQKGTLSGSGPTYTLPIGSFPAGGTLTVAVSKTGYDISGSPRSTTIYFYTISIAPNPIPLTENQWADGNIPTSSGEQWFTFTATASTQYIHVSFGTLTDLYVRVYDSSSATVGSEINLYGSTTRTSRSLTVGQTYFIRVRPYGSGSGAYRIGFNTITTVPQNQWPPNPIPLTEDQWTDGDITTSSGEQWFSLTATASTQFIHFELDTLTDMYVQVYTSSGATVENESRISSTTDKYISRSLTAEQTYYIKVRPYDSSGTYQIGFNASPAPLGTSLIIPLTANQWTEGNIPTSSDEQWFTFTATASTQYLHAEFGTLAAGWGIYVQVYNSSGTTVGNETNLYSHSQANYITTSTSRTLTAGQTYYIRVRPGSSSYTGTYRIGFNATFVSPDGAISLTANQWANGVLPTENDQQWFTFTGLANESSCYIHFEPGAMMSSVYVQVYDSSGTQVGGPVQLSSSTTNASRPTTPGQTYYIRVRKYNSSTGNTYRIGFNTNPFGGPIS